MMQMKYSGKELIRVLSEAFGPSGCEDAVRALIEAQIAGDCDAYTEDRVGNVIAKIKGCGLDYNEDKPRRLMLCAHMDEVGFMVNDLTDEGYVKFAPVGHVDERALCGRHVRLNGDAADRSPCAGVIATKAIHLQTREERTKPTPVEKLYINIGATDKADAAARVGVGDYAAFESDFVAFGKDGAFLKGKGFDGRLGCAALIEIMRDLRKNPCDRPFDIYFAFTTCEEVGISGAAVAAFTVAPDYAMVLNTSAAHDLPGVAEHRRVVTVGNGAVLAVADRGTIYDPGFVRFAEETAAAQEIPLQIKQAVIDRTDAAPVQRSLNGVRTLGLGLPVRCGNSASAVAKYDDYTALCRLVSAMVRDWQLD